MNARRARVIAAWLTCIALAAFVVSRARYVTDLSAFLPEIPTPMQRLLVDQLREGPASRVILIGLERGDAAIRARISVAMAHRLRLDREFSGIENGEPVAAQRDREFLFRHRYLLSETVTAQRFSAAGLKGAIEETVAGLASSEGMMLKSLVPRDPTGEMLQIVDQLSRIARPQTRGGVWVSADGKRTLLVAQTAAAGSDTDAQELALAAIRRAFAAACREIVAQVPESPQVQMNLSGPAVFAVAARATIRNAAVRLSIASGALIAALLLVVYRSPRALILGLLPVATGAMAGIAAVALGFGAVHGLTLGFGVTLIGESVDYSIYFFTSSAAGTSGAAALHSWRRRRWPIVRLGMLTSVCGFASLLPSGFPGLAQLGAYSIGGLLAAAAVTRFVLPDLIPDTIAIRDITPWGLRLEHLVRPVRGMSAAAIWGAALAIAGIAALVLYQQRDTLWNRELSSLSPIPLADQRYDAALRSDLGQASALDLVVVSGPDLESVLRGAERTARALEPLIDEKVIGGFDSPATYLPSLATQEARRNSLPEQSILRENLAEATAGLALRREQLTPFLDDVESARGAGLITPQDLRGTSLGAGFDALILHQWDRWNALLPLHAAQAAAPDIDLARVREALARAGSGDAQLLDLKSESDALYRSYLHEATRLSLAGLAAIVALLWIVLRSPARAARVLAPLILSVLCVAAALSLCGRQLTILHLVGMLLIVAVGSNYALFFDAPRQENGNDAALTLASLTIANLSTVIGFGLLSFSRVPVLEDLGMTVAPGALLALWFAAVLTPRRPAGTSALPQNSA
ncbi:MAG TPA: MMPL family transporter [Steroidobacteraceae bacterium]|nr:MMPL family transporter [Steroidobacteraceae bacterium]